MSLTFDQMDNYEREIAEILEKKHGFPRIYAEKTLEAYYPVMERIGWYEIPEEWADSLNVIIREKGLTSVQWNKRIDEKFGDEGIGPLKRKITDKHVQTAKEIIKIMGSFAQDND